MPDTPRRQHTVPALLRIALTLAALAIVLDLMISTGRAGLA